jgi:hypothetical protein
VRSALSARPFDFRKTGIFGSCFSVRYTAALGGEPVMPDLRQAFSELVCFANELWNAVDNC